MQRSAAVDVAILGIDLPKALRELLARADALFHEHALHGAGGERELADRGLEPRRVGATTVSAARVDPQARELRSGDSSGIVEATRRFQTGFQNWVETVGAARLAIGTVITLTAAVAVAAIWRSTATPPEHPSRPGDSVEQ